MRRSLLAIFTVILSFQHIQAQLGARQDIGAEILGIENVIAIDLDGDGDMDPIAYATERNSIVWFENTGDGQFGDFSTLIENVEASSSMEYGDIDGDEDIDLVVYSLDVNTFTWFENLGSVESWQAHEVEIPGGGISAMDLADLDQDDDLDLITASGGQPGVLWFENLGSGLFASPDTLIDYFSLVDALEVLDLSGDGQMDILLGNSEWPNLKWYEQGENMDFVEREYLVDGPESSFGSNFGIKDLDNDGDSDIYFGGYTYFQGLHWFENGGNGEFIDHVINTDYLEFTYFLSIAAVDLNNDDLPEIMATVKPFASDTVATCYFTNLGDGTFSDSTNFFIGNHAESTILVFDANNNGSEDFLFASETRDQIHYAESLGGGNYSDLTEVTDTYHRIEFATAVDLDEDGLLDFLFASSANGKIGWLKQLEDGSYSEPILLDRSNDEVDNLELIDRDGDGDLDLLWFGKSFPQYESSVGWLENLGDLNFGNSTTIYQGPGAYSAFDLDQDGDLDIVGRGGSQIEGYVGSIFWIERLDNGNFGTIDTLFLNLTPALRYHFSDIENDGDLDIILEGWAEANLRYRENLGDLEFGPAIILDDMQSSNPPRVILLDDDTDGDEDIFAQVYVAWGVQRQFVRYENFGNGEFGEQEILYSTNDQLRGYNMIDINSDDDPDFVFYNFDEDKIVTLVNAGEGDFGSPINLAYYDGYYASSLQGADFDGDDDLDLYMTGDAPLRIILFENLLYYPNQARGNTFIDLNINGILDSTDVGLSQVGISSMPVANYSFSYENGQYALYFDTDDDFVEIAPEELTGWGLTSDSTSYHILLDSATTSLDSLNFGFYPDSMFTSLIGDLTSAFPRCNTTVPFWISLLNNGTTLPSGYVQLVLDEEIEFQTAIPEPDSISGQSIYWSFDSLFFYSESQWYVEALMPSFESIGDTLISELYIYEYQDSVSIRLVDSLQVEQVLACAYDPNDKQVFPPGSDSLNFIAKDQELEYLIRFQNTGTDTAFHVILVDELSELLDLATFRPIASSHPMSVNLDGNGVLELSFLNILLPDSGANYTKSQGFAKFSISPKEGLDPFTEILNTAGIYFDFNPPIITNTVRSTIECYDPPSPQISLDDSLLWSGISGAEQYEWYFNDTVISSGVEEYLLPLDTGQYKVLVYDSFGCKGFSESFSYSLPSPPVPSVKEFKVFPNPGSGDVYFQLGFDAAGTIDLEVFNELGAKVLAAKSLSGELFVIPEGSLHSGMYIAVFTNRSSGQEIIREKFIILSN